MSDVEFVFDNDDLLRGKLVEPAWYRLKIGAAKKALSKAGDSENIEVPMRIISNADDGSDTYADVPVTARFNSKAKGFSIGFFAALGVEPVAGKPFSFSAAENREIEAFVARKEYEGKFSNEVTHQYRAAS